MKPITLVVDRDVQLKKGDYLLIVSETKFFVAFANESENEERVAEVAPVKTRAKPKKVKRPYTKRGRKNPKMPTREELELRQNRLLDYIIKHPGKTSVWYKDKMGLEGNRLTASLKTLIANKLVTCEYSKDGRINPWKPINPT